MFKSTAYQKKGLDRPLKFVLLNSKESNIFSDPSHPGSIYNLQKLTRYILSAVDVTVLHDFHCSSIKGGAFGIVN